MVISFPHNFFLNCQWEQTYIQRGAAHLALITSLPQPHTHLYSWTKRDKVVSTPCPRVLSPAETLAQPGFQTHDLPIMSPTIFINQ